MKIVFEGYKIRHKTFESEIPDRILIDISDDQREKVIDIIMKRLPQGMYKIEITPIIEEE